MQARISTSNLYDSLTGHINDLYANVGRLAQKRGTKQPYDSFKEVGSRYKISTVIECNQRYSGYQSYLNAASSASFKLDRSIESLEDVIKVAGDVLKELSIERNDVIKGGPEFLKTSLYGKLSEIQTMLNNESMGYYVFGGSKTNFPPVHNIEIPNFEVSNDPHSFSEETITTRYYTGNNDIQSVVLDKGLVLDYGVTANNPAIAKLIASTHMAMSYGDVPENLERAQNMLEETIQDLMELSQKTKYKKNVVDKYAERYNDLFLDLSETQRQIDESNGMDTLSIILQATNTETALSASQYLLIQMEQMSIMHFLQ